MKEVPGRLLIASHMRSTIYCFQPLPYLQCVRQLCREQITCMITNEIAMADYANGSMRTTWFSFLLPVPQAKANSLVTEDEERNGIDFMPGYNTPSDNVGLPNVSQAKAKILVIKDVERDDIEFLSKTLGCLPIAHVDHVRPEKLGHAALVEEESVRDVEWALPCQEGWGRGRGGSLGSTRGGR